MTQSPTEINGTYCGESIVGREPYGLQDCLKLKKESNEKEQRAVYKGCYLECFRNVLKEKERKGKRLISRIPPFNKTYMLTFQILCTDNVIIDNVCFGGAFTLGSKNHC